MLRDYLQIYLKRNIPAQIWNIASSTNSKRILKRLGTTGGRHCSMYLNPVLDFFDFQFLLFVNTFFAGFCVPLGISPGAELGAHQSHNTLVRNPFRAGPSVYEEYWRRILSIYGMSLMSFTSSTISSAPQNFWSDICLSCAYNQSWMIVLQMMIVLIEKIILILCYVLYVVYIVSKPGDFLFVRDVPLVVNFAVGL